MTLDPEDIDRIADLVATKLAAQRPQPRYVNVRGAAAYLAMSEDWVRAHAAELGGARMGDGGRGSLRFAVADLDAFVARRRLEPPAPEKRDRRPGRIPSARGVKLLTSRFDSGGRHQAA